MPPALRLDNNIVRLAQFVNQLAELSILPGHQVGVEGRRSNGNSERRTHY